MKGQKILGSGDKLPRPVQQLFSLRRRNAGMCIVIASVAHIEGGKQEAMELRV